MWGRASPYGLGLSRDGHIIFVTVYLTALLLAATVGAWRFYADFAPWFAQRSEAGTRVGRTGAATGRRYVHASFYPPIALAQHQQGDVLLELHVRADGAVSDAHVLHSSGFAQLDAAALISVGYWHYGPAALHGRDANLKVNIRYRLPA